MSHNFSSRNSPRSYHSRALFCNFRLPYRMILNIKDRTSFRSFPYLSFSFLLFIFLMAAPHTTAEVAWTGASNEIGTASPILPNQRSSVATTNGIESLTNAGGESPLISNVLESDFEGNVTNGCPIDFSCSGSGLATMNASYTPAFSGTKSGRIMARGTSQFSAYNYAYKYPNVL